LVDIRLTSAAFSLDHPHQINKLNLPVRAVTFGDHRAQSYASKDRTSGQPYDLQIEGASSGVRRSIDRWIGNEGVYARKGTFLYGYRDQPDCGASVFNGYVHRPDCRTHELQRKRREFPEPETRGSQLRWTADKLGVCAGYLRRTISHRSGIAQRCRRPEQRPPAVFSPFSLLLTPLPAIKPPHRFREMASDRIIALR